MSGPRRPQDDAISLSSDSSPEQSPVRSPKVMPTVPSRMSVNNLGQPVRGPDFNRPLALSPNTAFGNRGNQIDLTQDDEDDVVNLEGVNDNDEDEELRRAIAMSLQSHEEEQKRHEQATKEGGKQKESLASDAQEEVDERRKSQSRTMSPEPAPSSAPPPSTLGLLGLDRKAMEAERLARLKRKRDGGAVTEPKPAPIEAVATLPKAISTSETQQKRPRTADKNTSDLSLHTRTRPVSPPTRPSASGHSKSTPSTTSSSTTPLYPNGAILPTPSPSHPPTTTHPTISFPSLLAPTHPTTPLTSALLSSFATDFDWLLPHFNTHTVSFAFVLHTASPTHRAQLTTDFAGIPNVKLVFPDCVGGMKGGGTMHGKLCLLFFAGAGDGTSRTSSSSDDQWRHGRIRIAIPTGNLTAHDWGEAGGVMENLVFVADLPMLPASDVAAATAVSSSTTSYLINDALKKMTTPFQRSLTTYLTAQGVPQGVLKKLGRVDFGALPKDLAFVSSVAGFHWLGRSVALDRGTDVKERKRDAADGDREAKYDGQGLWNLSAAVRELDLLPPPRSRPATTSTSTSTSIHNRIPNSNGKPKGNTPTVQLDYATSSLGALTNDFLPALYDAARGLPQPHLSATSTSSSSATTSRLTFFPTTSSSSANTPGGGINNQNPWRAHTSIYFPSAQTVGASRGGTNAAGTICFQEKWWDRADFPREIVRDCVSVRDGMLGHYKMLLARSVEDEGEKGGERGSESQGVRGAGARAQLHKQMQTSAAAEELQVDDRGVGGGLRSASRDLQVRAEHAEVEPVHGERPLGFCYVGSANCSESAWGRAVFDKPNKVTKLTVRNWECGVAIPFASVSTTAGTSTNVRRNDHARRHQSPAAGGGNNGAGEPTQARQPPDTCEPIAALGRVVPVPMRVPGESLVLSGKAPWFFGGFGGD